MNPSAPIPSLPHPPVSPAPEPLPIAVRAYAQPVRPRATPSPRKTQTMHTGPEPLSPCDEVLIFDTETLTDPSQQLRVGPYQLRRADELVEQGFFYDPLTLSDRQRSTLYSYATE